MKVKKINLLPILAVAACVSNGTTSTARLSDTPVVSGGTYTTGGGITVAADMREQNGRTLICGVWAESRHQAAQARGHASRVVSTGAIYLDKKKVTQDLLFMRKVKPMADYGGQEAGCRLTARVWEPGDANRKPTIRIPRRLVAQDHGPSGSGLSTYFVQTGPGAGGS